MLRAVAEEAVAVTSTVAIIRSRNHLYPIPDDRPNAGRLVFQQFKKRNFPGFLADDNPVLRLAIAKKIP